MGPRLAANRIPLDGAQATILAAIDDADRERLIRLAHFFASANLRVSSRLLALPSSEPTDAPDRNLGVNEAAQRLGMSVHWIYRNAKKLPFSVRMGRRLFFRERGLELFIKQRSGR